MRRLGVAALSLALVLPSACSPVASPAPSGSGATPTGAPTAANGSAGTPTTGKPIVIALNIPPFGPSPFYRLSNAFGFRPPIRAEIGVQAIYNGIYRYDDVLEPVPDLAAEPCGIEPDQVTIICRLVDATFHDGTPLTADDVVFTYELARRHPDCLFGFLTCVNLEAVSAIDERTVEFRLAAPDATFLTLALPSIFIDSRAVVEAAYAPFEERASGLDGAAFIAVADEIDAQLASEAPDCDVPARKADTLFDEAALEPIPRDQFEINGSFDACLHAGETSFLLRDLAASLDATGLDAIALAYPALSFNRAPVGTGPWRFVAVEDGTRLVLEAYDDYHRGRPATPRVEVRVVRDSTTVRDGLVGGELDWVPAREDLYQEVKDVPDLQFATFPESVYYVLAYNLREGMLFADHDLRTAVELCIDKEATVDAATNGTGDPVYSPIDPVSWAYQPDLPRVERNVEEARRLIESAGWTEGQDGVYVRDGRRLATNVFVTADFAERVFFMDLVAEQVRDCGIELAVVRADSETVLDPLSEFPHIPGGRAKPFEAVFVGFGHGYDPHDDTWHSDAITTADAPRNVNFMGFSSKRADELIDAGIRTYDQRERARIYRELQLVLAEERPVLFAWAENRHEALDAGLALTDGKLNFASRQWMWQLEKLVLR